MTNGYLIVIDRTTGDTNAYLVSDQEDIAAIPQFDRCSRYRQGSLSWLPDNHTLLATYRFESAFAIDSLDGKVAYIPPIQDSLGLTADQDGYYLHTGMSPAGNFIHHWRAIDPSSSWYDFNKFDLWAMSSLLNLTADLRISRKGSAVVLKGSAADLNLEGYSLEYADVKEPSVWEPIQPYSTAPVLDDLFTTWVPPKRMLQNNNI